MTQVDLGHGGAVDEDGREDVQLLEGRVLARASNDAVGEQHADLDLGELLPVTPTRTDGASARDRRQRDDQQALQHVAVPDRIVEDKSRLLREQRLEPGVCRSLLRDRLADDGDTVLRLRVHPDGIGKACSSVRSTRSSTAAWIAARQGSPGGDPAS